MRYACADAAAGSASAASAAAPAARMTPERRIRSASALRARRGRSRRGRARSRRARARRSSASGSRRRRELDTLIVGAGPRTTPSPTSRRSSRRSTSAGRRTCTSPPSTGCARNWNSESSSVGMFPPVHVTFWITALSPEPVCCSTRVQPGLGANESIEKPCGTVRTIFVVVRFAFSVGTARLYSCNSFASETDGLIRACADAVAATTSAAVPASASTPIRLLTGHVLSCGRHERRPRMRPAQADARRGGPRFASPREIGARRGSSGSAAGAASTIAARRGRGGATRATARPARSAVRSRSRATT